MNGIAGLAIRRVSGLGNGFRWRFLMPLRDAIVESRRWRRVLFALGFGVIAVGALPPFYLLPLLIPAFTGLFWLVEGTHGRRQAFMVGWLFGFGYFTAGLYWVANAFFVRGGEFVAVAPIAVLGLAGLLAVFAGGATLTARVAGLRGPAAVLVFSVSWMVFEWLRSWVLTGFPWNLIGSVWAFSDAAIQGAAVFGTYGLGLITVAAATMPGVVADPKTRPRYASLAVAAMLAVIGVTWAGGAARLAAAGPAPEVPGVWLRLVQPNIPQDMKLRRDLVDEQLLDHLRLSVIPADPPPTHIIWGETAAPLFLADDPRLLALIGQYTPQGGLTIVGTMRRSPAGEPLQVWNSLLAIDDDGEIVGIYDKSHLVPGGEYIPFRDIIGLSKVTGGTTDFSAGQGLQTLDLLGLPPLSPLICYEVIFPSQVASRGRRPQWLLNLTNDAWYGISPGPFQHFVSARLRAVEEGLPLVRVANTGISAIVDSHGRVLARLGLGREGVVDGPLPKALASPTIYASFGNAVPLALGAAIAVVSLLVHRAGRSRA